MEGTVISKLGVCQEIECLSVDFASIFVALCGFNLIVAFQALAVTTPNKNFVPSRIRVFDLVSNQHWTVDEPTYNHIWISSQLTLSGTGLT